MMVRGGSCASLPWRDILGTSQSGQCVAIFRMREMEGQIMASQIMTVLEAHIPPEQWAALTPHPP